jgi:hypothetical protein
VTQLRQRLGITRSPRREQRWVDLLTALQAELPEGALDDALAQGMGWTLDQAVAAALRLATEPATA